MEDALLLGMPGVVCGFNFYVVCACGASYRYCNLILSSLYFYVSCFPVCFVVVVVVVVVVLGVPLTHSLIMIHYLDVLLFLCCLILIYFGHDTW